MNDTLTITDLAFIPGVLDTFTASYVRTALWSSTDNSRDDGGDPLDDSFDASDIAPATLSRMIRDCRHFQAAHAEDIAEQGSEQAGHDFWLTRNGHGCGFWDGDWSEEVGQRLTKASKAYGEVFLYVGDDGQIHAG
jgi:hypothetical protein